MLMRLLSFFALLALLSFCTNNSVQDLSIVELTCDYAREPLGVDSLSPRFSWITESTVKGDVQTAYRIVVNENITNVQNNTSEMWDSGKIKSPQTLHMRYEGKPLKSNTKYFWKVTVWDKNGSKASSSIASFCTVLLNKKDWKAQWIGFNEAPEPVPPRGFYANRKEEGKDTVNHIGRSVLLRKSFPVKKQVLSARLFVTGLGFYVVSVNGQRVGDHVLSPAKTPYHKYVLYDTYDVIPMLKKGENTLGIHLGNGWFNPYKKWWDDYRMQWFGYKKAIAQLVIKYSDGSADTIVTDKSWKKHLGPVLFNCVYDGEVYDANAQIPGWDSPVFDDSAWQNAVEMRPPCDKLVSSTIPPIRVIDTLECVNNTKPVKGVKVFDLGQNFAGWVKVKLKGTKGTKITIRFSEELKKDGTLDLTCNEHARATAEYVLKGGGTETYEPQFTYFGFQYAEVTSDGEMPEILSLKGCVVHSDNEQTGEFRCSYPLINKMHHATVWSQKSNMIGYPMDCPQRDERLGWMGDAQVTAEEALFNFDMALFYKNWFRGIRENQNGKTGDIPIISPHPYIRDEGIEWSSSYFTMVWQFYIFYGDKQVLAENYHAMKRYMGFLKKLAKNNILPSGWIGDWGSMVKGWKEGEPVSIPTAYYFYNALIMSKIAALLGFGDDHKIYGHLAQEIKESYNKNFFDEKTKDYNDGSQMANAFPLFLGLVPERYEKDVLGNLIADIRENDMHLTTGVLGTKYLFEALLRYDRNDIAWKLATQTTYPSWAEMMKKYNTMCEFWTLKQSHNHVMMGSVDSWFYKALAGIRPTEKAPAFKEFIIKPYPAEGLDSLYASTKTIRGKIVSNWKKTGEEFRMNVEIPFNTHCKVYLPGAKGKSIFINGKVLRKCKAVKLKSFDGDYAVLSVLSGKYEFDVR